MSCTNSPRIKREYLKAAQGTKGSWAGFLPPHIFVSRYMSTPDIPLQDPRTEPYANVKFPSCTGEDDDDHIEAFLNVIRDSRLCSDTVQLHVMGKVTPISLSSTRERKCIVKTPAQKQPATRHQSNNAHSSSTSPSITKSTGDTADNSVPTSFSWHQPGLFIEFAKNGDPFYDTPADWKEHRTNEKDDFRSAKTRGKLALYAREAFYHQHRTHLFQLLIFGDEVRFIRWDRAGASLSHKFNFVENPEPLKNFFSVYGRMNEIARGWDSTVALATPQEEQLYQTACADRFSSLPPVDTVRMVWEAMPAMDLSSTWDDSWPTYRVTLDLVDGLEESDALIIKRPFYHVHERIVGRTARAYLAYSMKLGRLVFFKDGWRKDSKRYVSEAEAYKRLRRFQVAYTPETLAGGDVRGSTTRTNELIRQIVKRPEGSEQVLKVLTDTPLRQHQIVQELACPLQYLPSTKDVVGVIWDCYIAILQAGHAGLLHRDISVANVMARYNVEKARWEGILNDWDVCGLIKTYFDRTSTRVGTWNYLSIENLQDPSKQHDVMDELQSLFWVLLYAVAFYFNPSAQLDLAMFLEQHTSKIDGREQQVAGRMKLEFLKDDKIQPFIRDVKSKSLEWLLVTMATHWKEYYLLRTELAREEIKGVHNALCLAKYLTGVSQVASAKQVDAAKSFARKHALVSDPQFWINMCNKAIDIDSWVPDAAPEKPKTSRRKKEGEVATAMAQEMRVIRVERPTTTIAKGPDDEQDTFSHLGQVTGGRTASGSGREGQHSSPNKRSREAIDTDPQIGASSLSAKKPRPVTCSADAQQDQEIHEVSYAESRSITRTAGERLAAEITRQLDLNLSKGSILDRECDVDGDSGVKLVDSLKMNGEFGKTLPY